MSIKSLPINYLLKGNRHFKDNGREIKNQKNQAVGTGKIQPVIKQAFRQREKTADISRRHHWFPREMMTEKRAQKFHTDDALLYPDLGSDSDQLKPVSQATRGPREGSKAKSRLRMLSL